MSIRTLKICVLLSVVNVFAQESAKKLSLDECISLALKNSPSLSICSSKKRAAQAKVLESTFAFTPQLKLTGRIAEVSPVSEFIIPPPLDMTIYPSITEQYGIKLSLQQPLFTGFKLWETRKIAKHSISAAEIEYTKEEKDLIFNVTLAYWNLYRIIKTEEIIKRSLNNMKKQLEDVQNFVKQGMATDADIMKVRMKITELTLKHIDVVNGIKLAEANLNTVVKIPEKIEIETSTDISSLVKEADVFVKTKLSDLIDSAYVNRPEIELLLVQNDINKRQIELIKGGWYPDVYLMANYDYARPNQRNFPIKDEWDGSWDVGIYLQWNIWDRLSTYYQKVVTKESLNQIEDNLQKIKDVIALEVTQSYYSLISEKEKIEAMKENLAAIKENYRVTQNKFEKGIVNAGEVTEAETSLLFAEQNLLNALVDCKIAIIKLKKAAGIN